MSRAPIRIRALATNPETGASTRFRVLQWRQLLAADGCELSLDAFFTSDGERTLHAPGRRLAKAAFLAAGTARRLRSLWTAPAAADLLFIHREAFPLGQRWPLALLRRFRGPIIYDYDDAMFLPQRQGRGLLARLEDVNAPQQLMRLSDVVLAGNEYLAEYARRYARRVVVLPTCVDTRVFAPRPGRLPAGPPVLGWIGSHSTAKYLRGLQRALEAVARRVPFRLYVVGASEPVTVDGAEVIQRPWRLEREVEDFASCDVGLYPLWDDAWARGKCGFKAIEFMACGVPVVASAVGANREIIHDGADGFLVADEAAWVERLTALLSDRHLRERFGQLGREAIDARYSVQAQGPRLVAVLRSLFASRPEPEAAAQAGEPAAVSAGGG